MGEVERDRRRSPSTEGHRRGIFMATLLSR